MTKEEHYLARFYYNGDVLDYVLNLQLQFSRYIVSIIFIGSSQFQFTQLRVRIPALLKQVLGIWSFNRATK